MIAIYAPYYSNRLNYILNYIFKQQYGLEYTVFSTLEPFISSENIKINYSEIWIENTFNITPSGLLFENNIVEQPVIVSGMADFKIIFKTENDYLGFDIFSAVFYCLSRYEEYTCQNKDTHGRFSHTNSFAYKNNCLDLPLVDIWLQYLSSKLKIKTTHQTEFTITPTMDIDAVFAYNGRNICRQIAGFGKSLFTFNFQEFSKRIKVVFLSKKDPNNNFEYQIETFKKHNLKAHYFIQVGAHGAFDKNISLQNKAFQEIILNLKKEGHSIGLHPSYNSHKKIQILKNEKEILETILLEKISNSRQHYLKMELPRTYQNLIELGIKKDFSMGYSQVSGFRAGTSQSFFWYDLSQELETSLEIVPFCAMDVMYKQFLGLNIEDTLALSEKIKSNLKSIKGQFCFVFHNESLSEHRGWQCWRKVFEKWLI